MKIYKTIGAVLLLSGIYIACGKTESESTESDSSETTTSSEPTPGTVGALAIPGSDDSKGMTGVTSQISTVEADMIPASLEISNSNLTQGDNPCAGLGFFECQPNLLKVYSGIAKQMVGMTKELVSNTSSFIDSLKVGESGVLDITDDDEVSKIHYNVESAEAISLVMESSTGVFLDFTISLADTGNQYKIKMDTANTGDSDGAKIDADITFLSATNFDVDVKIIGDTCDANDPRAPSNIGIKVKFENGTTQGKASMYHARWIGDVTCDTTPTDSTSVFLYTDFAGNDTNTTASLYIAPGSFSDVSGISSYEIQNFCSVFIGNCQSESAFGETNVIADTYINPYCVTGSATNWNGACTDFPITSYSAASNWLSPASLKDYTVTLRESL